MILEVRENESRYSHPIFPYIAPSRDVILPNLLFNRDLLKNIWTHFVYKVELTQDLLYNHEPPVPTRTDDYGFASSTDTASIAKLNEIKIERSTPKAALKKFEIDFYAKFSRSYLEQINALCKKNGIEIIFLYLPS